MVILIILLAALMYLLLENKYRMEIVALSIALVMVNVWFVPLCLEYYWMFLVMFLSSIVAVKFVATGKDAFLDYLFLITGIVAAFLDFLTIEIITALVPLLLVLSIRRRKGQFEDSWKMLTPVYRSCERKIYRRTGWKNARRNPDLCAQVSRLD